jgi:hypothetical protein
MSNGKECLCGICGEHIDWCLIGVNVDVPLCMKIIGERGWVHIKCVDKCDD